MKRILTALLIAGIVFAAADTAAARGSEPLTGESNVIVMLALGLALSVGMIGISAVVLRKCRKQLKSSGC